MFSMPKEGTYVNPPFGETRLARRDLHTKPFARVRHHGPRTWLHRRSYRRRQPAVQCSPTEPFNLHAKAPPAGTARPHQLGRSEHIGKADIVQGHNPLAHRHVLRRKLKHRSRCVPGAVQRIHNQGEIAVRFLGTQQGC